MIHNHGHHHLFPAHLGTRNSLITLLKIHTLEYHAVEDKDREDKAQPPYAGFVVEVEGERPQAGLEGSVGKVFGEEVENDSQPDRPSFSLGFQLRASWRHDGVGARDKAKEALA